MAEFRTVTEICLPGRIFFVGCVYNDTGNVSNYLGCADLSDKTNKHFAWKFAVAFGTSVPALRVKLTDSVAGTLLVDDNTASPTGTWEKSTDGGSTWVAWTNADKGNDITFLRYTPASLADNLQVTATLLLN
jgi:hypothetical protein